MSGTLADFINYYPQAWPTASSRPGANICTVQYDFEAYYKDRINPIKGFTKTKLDPGTVHAWRVERDTGGIVGVKWKPEARLNTDFLGVDSTAASDGFILLRNTTSLGPVEVPGHFLTVKSERAKLMLRDLKSDAILAHLTAEGLADSIPWLVECATTGKIPILRVIEESVPAGEIGRLVEIGVGSRSARVRTMDSPPLATADEFFKLPGLEGRRIGFHGTRHAQGRLHKPQGW